MVLDDFAKKIAEDINTSGLSIDAICFVMRDIMRELEDTYRNTVLMEQQQKEKEQATEKEEEK